MAANATPQAGRCGNTVALHYLAERRADINVADAQGRTALMCAAR
jgi:hypothetical protein